jgi:phosphatidylserine/phosphatidylglycerophosphate/cardiolipin synthase-like enzyme/uncharacterized membrane protein YdjX (TVP38/TMEM64 family)
MTDRALDDVSVRDSSAPHWTHAMVEEAATRSTPARLLIPGETCWRIEHAERASVLIDADAYFTALRAAMIAARRQIVIVGWDVDSRTRLSADARPKDGFPAQLLPLLKALLRRSSELQVFILAWDFSMIYTLERELMPSLTFSKVHPRLHFMLDGVHAVGASHHQKLAVIDDCLAFAGGVDLTIRRWDRPAHRADERARKDPFGAPYLPMHDVQLCFDGAAAGALAELARWRWARAARGFAYRPAAISGERLWPRGLAPDFGDLPLGISRTYSGSGLGDQELREVETLICRAIRTAQRYVYIENQYLTASSAARALVDSLAQPQGPELCVVLPQLETGWLEQSSMGVLRRQVLARLRAHDPHGRLHLYYPKLPGTPHGLQVHCKLMIIDDALLTIGSANLSNRSLGLDTECDVTIEARPGDRDAARICAGVRRVLAKLLAEHLELSEAECSEWLQHGSPYELIESRRGRERCLEQLPESLPDPTFDLGALGDWVIDPERPMAGETFIEGLFPIDLRHPILRSVLASLVMLSPVLVMAGVFQEHSAWFDRIAHAPLTDAYLWLGFAAGCLTFVPVSLQLAAAAVIFDPGAAIVFGVSGALVASAVAYGVGRCFRPLTLRLVRGRRAHQLQRSAKVRAFRATVIARLLPVGNFTASNLLAGALNVPFPRFLFGNLAGLSFGVVMLVLFAKRALKAFAQPSTLNTLAGVAAGAAMIGLCYAVASLFEHTVRREKVRASAPPPRQEPVKRREADAKPEPLPEPESNDPPPPSAAKAEADHA